MIRIGIDLGGTKIEVIALDENGAQLYRQRTATPKESYEKTIAAIVQLVQQAENHIDSCAGEKASVGVGIPGAISPKTNLVKNANSTCLIGHALDKDLSDLLQREVRVANDANCFVVSEATDGAAAGANVTFGVIIGTGTGGGIAIKGRPLTGINAITGEWGHNTLPWPDADEIPGHACYCGHTGCIETFLSGPGFTRHFQAQGGTAGSALEILQLVEAGDALAVSSLKTYERRLAKALASVINLLDPDVIVLGGGMSNIRSLYSNVPLLWGEYVFSDHVATRLLPPMHGDSSGVRGAACLWPL